MMTYAFRSTIILLSFTVTMAGLDLAKADSFKSYDGTLTATALGSSYSLTTDSSGYTTAITSADGSQSFVYDKYPVYHEMVATTHPSGGGYDYNGATMITYTTLYNSYGSESFDYYPRGAGNVAAPFTEFAGKWYLDNYGSSSSIIGPVNDFNIHGQAVGQDGILGLGNPSGGTTSTGATSTQFGPLQSYFPDSLGLQFTDNIGIDDLGQIISVGTLNGQPEVFLVSPGNGPTPTPEPSAFVLMGGTLAILGLRSIRRRR